MPEPGRPVTLTDDMIPAELRTLSFKAGERLQLSLPQPLPERFWTLSGSLAFYLAAAWFLFEFLTSTFGLRSFFTPIAVIAAGCLCILLNYRGIVLTISLRKPKFRLVTAASFASGSGTPGAALKTTSGNGSWTTELFMCGRVVATRTSGISAEDAERPFKVFASAFPSAPLLLPQTPPDNMPATQTAPGRDRPALPKESPLVILVHGTWATKSLWAMPDPSVSKFVSWIMKHVSIPLDNFRRLPWSGDNQVGARIEAAVRLREMIRTELGKADRLVFIMAHSHGGNVVMNAIEGLTKEEQQSLRLVLMATPFLNNIQRFDIRYLFGLLPSYVQSNLFEIGALGSFVVSALIFNHLKTTPYFDDTWKDFWFFDRFGLVELVLFVAAIFSPFVVYQLIWRRLARLIGQLPRNMTDTQDIRSTKQTLAIAFSQDEAFMALSVVVNLLSLLHQILFLLIAGIAWASRKIRIIDWLGELPWIIFFGILTLIMWGVIASILAQTLAGVFPALEVPVAHFEDWAVGIQKQYLAPTLDFSFGFFLVFCFVIALVISVASMSMILLGGIRISIFESIGVLDQARSQAELFEAAVGAVVVSMMPEGDAQTLMVNGRSLFNHTTIYNDLRVQERIAIFMKEQITAAAGNTALGVPETSSPFI